MVHCSLFFTVGVKPNVYLKNVLKLKRENPSLKNRMMDFGAEEEGNEYNSNLL